MFFVSADSTGFRIAAGLGIRSGNRVALPVRISIIDNTIDGNTVVIRCQGPKWEELDSTLRAARAEG
jgi:hypothetical protein